MSSSSRYEGVVQCCLQAGFFVAAQSSVQVELRVKLLLEAMLVSCKLRTVEIMPFDATPYRKLRPRMRRRIRIDPMKLLAFQKRATLGKWQVCWPAVLLSQFCCRARGRAPATLPNFWFVKASWGSAHVRTTCSRLVFVPNHQR